MVLRILLVDDEEIVRQTLGDFLHDCGHHVTLAADGREGLECLQAACYDVALLDVHMPGLDGLSLLEQGRARRPETRFIIVTGHADAELSERAERLGAALLLLKPIRLAELRQALAQLTAG